MTTQAYAPLTQAQQIFYDLIWQPMIKAGESYIEGVAPVLALPVIKQIDEATIQAITDYVFQQVVLLIDVTAIKLVNSAHQTAFDDASLQLAIVAQEQGIKSDAYIKARALALVALSQFTRFGA